ncbi:FemAB family XrtA/PEP-CTERM system-associated protein [Sphingosinicella sp. CPCC 101087]|uniref:FemAB family XrtA/PEP-CTERM system-associated protein n=1 Tax=Sphingosinicella sp. CPCC 101087 TaxID=2497754 RepID=UPI00101D7CE4|nr:FemAB family XrtA/PEP-CTERM system-associated protein [Sphingosinicella sp. CPCC 101087]
MLANLAGPTVRIADLADPAERRRIDDFVRGQAECGPFHRPGWSRGVEAGTGQPAHYLVAERGDGTISGVLPLSRIGSPIFGTALVSAGFGVGGGIAAMDEEAIQALADAAWAAAQAQGCASVELRGGPVPSRWQKEEGVYAGFARALPKGDEAILKAIPRKQRAEVRRAMGLGLEVRSGRSPELVDLHYRVYAESVRNLGTPVFPRSLFRAMLEEFGEDADILVVLGQGRPTAAVLSFYDKGTVFPYWGGGTRDARRLRANDLMYFALMRQASERGCARFDFGRSKVGTGAFAFKKNWGFTPEPLTYARQGAHRDINPLSPKHRMVTSLWQRLPLGVANRLGPFIAKGLG